MVATTEYNPDTMSPFVDHEDEVALSRGQPVTVFGDPGEDGYYVGETRGVRGLFPQDVLAPATSVNSTTLFMAAVDPTATASDAAFAPSTSSAHSGPSKSVPGPSDPAAKLRAMQAVAMQKLAEANAYIASAEGGDGDGDVFARTVTDNPGTSLVKSGTPDLESLTTTGNSAVSAAALAVQQPNMTTNPTTATTTVLKSIYPYTGRKKSELSFEKGETFTLVEKTSAEWTKVTTSAGAIGFVPANYVKVKVRRKKSGSTSSLDKGVSAV
jgi:hypothetical protein